MAKKQPQPAPKFRTAKLASGKVQIYNGRKKATEAERKQYIKLNGGYGMLPPDSLTPKEQQLAKKVKAGKARAANAVTDMSGKFLSKAIIARVEKILGGSLDPIMKAKGAKTLKELLIKDPLFKEEFFNIVDKTEDKFHFNSNHYITELKGFPGKIFINGNKVTKEDAIKEIADRQAAAAQRYQKGFDFSVQYHFIGLRELRIELPSVEDITTMDLDEFDTKYGETFKVYGSP